MDGTVLITPCSALSERLQAALNIYATPVCTHNKHGAISEKICRYLPLPTTTPLAVTSDGVSDCILRLQLDGAPHTLLLSLLLPAEEEAARGGPL